MRYFITGVLIIFSALECMKQQKISNFRTGKLKSGDYYRYSGI